MKSNARSLVLTLFSSAVALVASGCTIAATPHHMSVAAPASSTTVVHQAAPARVYHSGQWLHYRSDAYYYRSGSSWVVASSVPTHVVSYHRPSRPVHVVHHTPAPSRVVYHSPARSRVVHHSPRPPHVVHHSPRPPHVTTTRPSPRPSHVTTHRPAPRPTAYRSSSPRHVQTTVHNRRTYYRR